MQLKHSARESSWCNTHPPTSSAVRQDQQATTGAHRAPRDRCSGRAALAHRPAAQPPQAPRGQRADATLASAQRGRDRREDLRTGGLAPVVIALLHSYLAIYWRVVSQAIIRKSVTIGVSWLVPCSVSI